MAVSSVMPVDSQLPLSLAVSVDVEGCSPRSTSQVTRPSTAVITSCTVEDPSSVMSTLVTHLGSRVTLAELQPAQPTLVTSDTSHDLKTCFTGPLTTSEQVAGGSSRTTYGPMQISAQVLSLPRSITNCRNLSRPLTLCYAGRQIIVPPSCIVLSAEGAKLLLPPQTIVPSKPPPDPIDLSSENTGSISSTANLKTSGLISVSESKNEPESETALSDRADNMMLLSAEYKDRPAIAETVNVPVMEEQAQPSLEAYCSTESANNDQQILSSEEQKCAIDQCKEINISKLNDRDLVHIFTFVRLTDLLRVSQVCSRWNAVARDPSLVSHIMNFASY